jgi:ketosteroid isomerase-like protein
MLSITVACQQQQTTTPDTRAADEAALKATDEAWAKAAASKDVDKTVAFYSDDATVLPPNSPAIIGKEPIRGMWKSMIEPAGSSISWKVTKVEVAKSGEMGYVSGTYEMTDMSTGKPVNDRGKYLEVWKKQADGSWKCVADMFSSDLPAAPTAATPATNQPAK